MIIPSVGRVVWYWPLGNGGTPQPWAALVAFVHHERLVNLAAFSHSGRAQDVQSVVLRQPEDPAPPAPSPYCEWMPYQKGQAAKTEELERERRREDPPSLR